MQTLKNKNIIVLAHVLTTVPAEDLETYFNKHKTKNLFYIGHPLFYKEGRPGSHYRLYEKGKLVKTHVLKNRAYPSLYQYLRDTVLTIYWIVASRKKWDIVVALDNLNTLAALFLRKIGIIKKVIYYTIDFTPDRFSNKFLNDIYHAIDKYCVANSDITWNISPRMIEGREKIRGLDPKKYNKQITVPVGIWLDRIESVPAGKIEPHTVVYAGGLSPHQGIQVVLDAIPKIVKEIPDFKFIIIGMGSYEKELKKKIKLLKISKFVDFVGYIEKHEDVEKRISRGAVAMAMYSKELSLWSYYADPSKIKTYLACGLPVITTSLTHIAQSLQERNCGIVIPYNKDDLAKATIAFLKDRKKQRAYRINALRYAKDFSWDTVISKGLKKVL